MVYQMLFWCKGTYTFCKYFHFSDKYYIWANLSPLAWCHIPIWLPLEGDKTPLKPKKTSFLISIKGKCHYIPEIFLRWFLAINLHSETLICRLYKNEIKTIGSGYNFLAISLFSHPLYFCLPLKVMGKTKILKFVFRSSIIKEPTLIFFSKFSKVIINI